jgi:glutamate dehydrogenase (NADP+)
MDYIEKIMNLAKRKNCINDTNFFQALYEILESIKPLIENNTIYEEHNILERMIYPNQELRFKVEWIDDAGKVNVNTGYRIQFNNALGIYKGGTRFHSSVNEDILKFLAFEQVFKNALTGQHIGGAKGGADFDPKGKSNHEIMRFCQSYMNTLHRHIASHTDVLGGDMGVGSREVGYLVGAYRRLTNTSESIITSKPLFLGGSKMRNEATGYGLIYFTEQMIADRGLDFKEKKCVVSGSGNVALHAIEKLYELGAVPVTASDSKGAIYDPRGVDLALLKEIKLKRRISLESYIETHTDATYTPVENYSRNSSMVWEIPCFAAFACATQNELDDVGAKCLIEGGVKVVAEGANMPSTPEAVELFQNADVLFGPAKAANAGGVAMSAVEMSQNSSMHYLTFEEADNRLKQIMEIIYKDLKVVLEAYKLDNNYLSAANILGFKRVADAMIMQGV